MLVRLSCLARVQEEKDYLQLRAAWDALKARERAALTDHFLADGIQAGEQCHQTQAAYGERRLPLPTAMFVLGLCGRECPQVSVHMSLISQSQACVA